MSKGGGVGSEAATHIGALDVEGLGHFLQELVLLAVEREGLRFLVFLSTAGVAALRLPDRFQHLFLLASCNRVRKRA